MCVFCNCNDFECMLLCEMIFYLCSISGEIFESFNGGFVFLIAFFESRLKQS